jgi:glycosyltransferase involved in cell wall biosynthesis
MQDLTKSIKLHIWCPNVSGSKGGIQVYSMFLLQALDYFQGNVQYEVFTKHDNSDSKHFQASSNIPKGGLHSAGKWSPILRTSAFATQIVGYALLERPDLIITTHLHFSRAAYRLKRMIGVPYWVIAHGIEAWDIKQPGLRKALQHADRILAVSSYTRNRIIEEQQLESRKVTILPNTFDPTAFNIGPKPEYLLHRYGLSPERQIILTVSRLVTSEQYKGYDRILKALPKIRQAVPNVHYIIAGQGDDRPRIETLINELNINDIVTLAGYLPDEELCDHYNLCDVFAMPSKREGFGIVYLEALACGKPVIAGNKDGAIDALCHGKLGALVDPDDIAEIAKTLIDVLIGKYPHPVMYKPEVLRQMVTDEYGLPKFKHIFEGQLEKFIKDYHSISQ